MRRAAGLLSLGFAVVVAWTLTAAWHIQTQYYLPAEDFHESQLPALLAYGLLAGVAVAAHAMGQGRRSLLTAIGLVTLPLTCDLLFFLLWWPVAVGIVALGLAAHWLTRGRLTERMVRIAALAIVWPMLLASASVQPLTSHLRWNWPWLSFRAPIRMLLADADRAADALGLPTNRRLTDEEVAALEARTPLRLTLEYPFTGQLIWASVLNNKTRMPKGEVFLWWGGPDGRATFGPLDTTWMIIRYASD
jgi:hypothetical protein